MYFQNGYSSLFEANLGKDCSNAANPDLVVPSLKAIGNIGSFQNINLLNACIGNKGNSLEVRVSAIQAFRRFGCSNLPKASNLMQVFSDQDEDTELRINAFQLGIQCSDDSEARKTIEQGFPKLLEVETNVQVNFYLVTF